jgi:RNA polymerase sigma factor (sigma-70 family)
MSQMGISPKMDADEKELIRKARGGDTTAFDELVRRYAGYVKRIALAILPDWSEAEDVVQETFLKAYRSIARFKGQCKFSTWLHPIAARTAYDFIRRNRTPRALPLDEPKNYERIKMYDSNPETGVTRRGGKIEPYSGYHFLENKQFQHDEVIQIAYQALETLKFKEQAAAYASFFRGYDDAEVANMLGLRDAAQVNVITRKFIRHFVKAMHDLQRSRKSTQLAERSP